MNLWSFASYVLMAGILFMGMTQVSHADPATVVPKPKLAPRAIPGMGGGSHDDHGHGQVAAAAPADSGTVVSTKTKPAVPIAANSGFKRPVIPTSGDQARIVYIYRRGTVELPSQPIPASLSAPKAAAEINAAPSIIPRPGQVRVISKADADMLLAQPELQK
jgi:hypothetical protein